jgi:predicted metalloenzyme YecM
MDAELREAFQQVNANINRSEGKIESVGAALNLHVTTSGINHATVKASTDAAHKRLDEHLKGHWWWMGVLGSIIAGIGVFLIIALIKLAARMPQ